MNVKTFSPNALSRRLAKGSSAPAGPATPAKKQLSLYNSKKAGSLFKGANIAGKAVGARGASSGRVFKGMKK